MLDIIKAAKLAMICFMVGCVFSTQGHQHYHHSHGEGELFMVHDKDNLQVKFVLPAGDIFGFEHQPQTAEQKQFIKQTLAQLTDYKQLVTFNAECKPFHSSLENPFEQQTHNSHYDLEIEFSFRCDKPASKVTVSLFAWAKTLSVIKAQWIKEQAQGIAELTAAKPYIEWPL
ncbi:ZrgA family zinc uptake protein [Pseudoalteromonas lipolytica]|uniref:DUF2796 domain-containing protein n=1 Tax=Pseudoalteromonas lipolytica TaxID=570156 RepID=A0ABU8T078_9GAMM